MAPVKIIIEKYPDGYVGYVEGINGVVVRGILTSKHWLTWNPRSGSILRHSEIHWRAHDIRRCLQRS